MGVWLAYLRLTLAYSKGESEGCSHFDCEYLKMVTETANTCHQIYVGNISEMVREIANVAIAIK